MKQKNYTTGSPVVCSTYVSIVSKQMEEKATGNITYCKFYKRLHCLLGLAISSTLTFLCC